MSDISTNLSCQVQNDYLAYSMAVLVGRAIPSLTDGLKPAQRRILTAMKWLGLNPDGKYMKSARVEGEVMGKLHPHGSAYGAMVTLAAPWSNNLPFIDGHGNWGSSVDGAAASRYTECKLTHFAWNCLLTDSETWVTRGNYDDSLQEPVELNVKIPVVLLNGQEGIGVGFATKIPPHSLRDICTSLTKGTPLVPSFPTGCDIVNDEGLNAYQHTGVGALRLRAKCEVTTTGTGRKQKQVITFTNLPAGTNPEKIGEQIASALEKGTIGGITHVIDESDLTGDRISVTVKTGTDITLIQRQLYCYTDLDTKYSARLLVVDGTRPLELSPSQLLTRWKEWRMTRLSVQFAYELDATESRLEVVRGYLKAIQKIDPVIKIIKAAATPKEALIELVSNRSLKFTSDQARAILEMRLRTLTNLDSKELAEEEERLIARTMELGSLIVNEKERNSYMAAEIKSIGVKYGETRRSEVIDPPDSLTLEKGPSGVASPVSKPRFLKVDSKRGIIEQAKGPRGALIVEKTDKIITLTQNGILRKLPATFKGPISGEYSSVILVKKEIEIKERKYLAVFTLDNQLKAMTIIGEDLCKVTSKGKHVIPPEANLIYFGEGLYQVPWSSNRKKKVELSPNTMKQGKPGARGIKVASITDLAL